MRKAASVVVLTLSALAAESATPRPVVFVCEHGT